MTHRTFSNQVQEGKWPSIKKSDPQIVLAKLNPENGRVIFWLTVTSRIRMRWVILYHGIAGFSCLRLWYKFCLLSIINLSEILKNRTPQGPPIISQNCLSIESSWFMLWPNHRRPSWVIFMMYYHKAGPKFGLIHLPMGY